MKAEAEFHTSQSFGIGVQVLLFPFWKGVTTCYPAEVIIGLQVWHWNFDVVLTLGKETPIASE